MTDEEARAWIAAGNYTNVAGVPLHERTAQKIAQLATGDEEVEGFGLDFGDVSPASILMPETDVAGKGPTSLFRHCCTGQHLKKVVITVR